MTPIKRLIAVFLALFGLTASVPAQRQGDVPDGAAAYDLRVMSYNVYVYDALPYSHAKRVNGIVSNITACSPDVFGLQEANPDWMERLPALLPDYAFVGVGRDDGGKKGEYSPVFYKKDKYTLLDGGTFWFSDTPDVPSKTWLSAYNRICSWCLLEDNATGFIFAVLNSHWDHLSIRSRNNSALLLLEKAEEYAPDVPVIITGDFNCKAKTVAYASLIEGGFTDCMYTAPDTDSGATYHGYYKTNLSQELPIDHILFKTSNGRAESYRVIRDKYDGIYPSDHFPIVADVTLFTQS